MTNLHLFIPVLHTELDLRNQSAVDACFSSEKPDVVIDAEACVGGILANNDFPYQFLMDNMQIQNNLIDAAHLFDVQKFIFLGSSCIFPKLAPQPLKEEYLLPAPLELIFDARGITDQLNLPGIEFELFRIGK